MGSAVNTDHNAFNPKFSRSNWVRLRTLIVLRWVAIFGQLSAITVAQRLYDLDLNLGLCFLAIGASIIANLVAVFVYPENKRLSENEVAGALLFDISQLSFLVFLTGGLNNPFALLILAPVTISATTLHPRSTALIGAATITMASVLAVWHLPLVTVDGNARCLRHRVLGRHRHRCAVPRSLCNTRDVRGSRNVRSAGGHTDGTRPRTETDRPRRGCRGGGA